MSKILVVDDNHDAAETMAMLLKLRGHDVQVAFDGNRAVEIAQRMRPNFVLLDIRLPRMDGYEIASKIRRESAAATHIIAITGCGEKEDRERAAAAGFDHYFLKPVDHDALMSLLVVPAPEPRPAVQDEAPPDEPACATVRRHIEIINDLGLHLRAASKFAQLAQQFQAEVRVVFDGRQANGRSILDLATLAAECGRWINLEAEGPDADAVLDALIDLVNRGFDEFEQDGDRGGRSLPEPSPGSAEVLKPPSSGFPHESRGKPF